MDQRLEPKRNGFNWQTLIIAAVPVIGAFSVVQFRVNAQSDDIKTLYQKTDKAEEAITTIKVNVDEVKEDVSDIKSDVKDIQAEQVAQGRILERILAEVVNDASKRNR